MHGVDIASIVLHVGKSLPDDYSTPPPKLKGIGNMFFNSNAQDLQHNQCSSFVTFMIRTSTINQINLSNEKRDPERCLGYIGDEIIPSYAFHKPF